MIVDRSSSERLRIYPYRQSSLHDSVSTQFYRGKRRRKRRRRRRRRVY